MEEIRKRLALISKIWNNYVWKYKFIQDQVNYTPEVKTNYYGDILFYFNDTFELLKVKPASTFNNAVFNAIGLMQIVFVHQDLMDELLTIFKLPKSEWKDKNPNRTIRNQLTGHPLSRNNKKELVSSVFFGNEMSEDTIHYILYAVSNDFKGEDIFHRTSDILDRHSGYLVKYADKILDSTDLILTSFREKLTAFGNLVQDGSAINDILEQADNYFESIYKESYVFKREYLLWYHAISKKHPRYPFALELFLRTLSYYLQGKIEDIDEIISGRNTKKQVQEVEESPEIIIVAGSEISDQDDSFNLSYLLSKLMGRHPIYGVSYFKTKFKDRKDIQEELSNMENNYDFDREYFASFEYIKFLLNDQGIL